MNVKSFKLLTGEELVAEVLDPHAVHSFDIQNPLVLHVMNSEQGPQMAFAPWSMIHTEDQRITVYQHALVCAPADVLDPVEKSYLHHTTGLVIPPAANGSSILLG